MSAPAPPPKCDPAAQDRRAGGIWLPPGTLRAVLLMLLAVVAFAAMNATIRYLSARLHPFEIAFFRNAFMVACLLPVVLRQGWRLLATDRFPLHLMRGAVNTVSMLSFFMAMSLLPLADASALTFTGPLFAAVMAVALFREPIKPRRVVALAVGFGGALVVLRPGFQEIGLGQVMILTSVLLWSFVLMMLKSLSRTEASLTITVYMGLIVTPFSLIAAVFVWQWPTAEEWAWLGFIGLCGTIGQVAFVQALKEGDVGLVLPLDFTKLIWMAGFGYLVFGEVPDLTTILGGVAIGATATYLAVSEAREERRAKPNAAGDQQR